MTRDPFVTVHSEGALLPSDFIQRIAEGDKDIPGLSPADYHLQEREKLSEAITRSWNRLLGFWAAFQSASATLKEGDAAIGLTRDKWLLPLFQELGYGRLPAGKGFEIEGKSYPISHVWQNTPIHILGRNVDLDRPTKGVAGAAKGSPHGLLQEFLNRHEGHLWGFLSNGLKLRILRDNKSLTRQAYVEFDLDGMMDGQVYSDFALLWLLCQQSRVEAERAEQCWLEKWADVARQRGTRALEQLREGVEDAIRALGRGFLAHPANKDLTEKLRDGTLNKQDYYRQLLRTVYRLIFLFVAEDRALLLTAKPGSNERERYVRHYSVSRLRTLAERRRGSPHADLWQALRLVFDKLSSDTGCPELGLPALGSFLWSAKATPDLDRCGLANADLLEAVRSLAFTLDGKIRRAIDYRNLGAEELGSVYESLLELHPDVNADAPTFDLKVTAGHERKTTGSYYTPTSLIECLLDSALEPVLQEAAKKPDPEKAILDLKVCDPACGSGHFLIAAAHRMANRLAAIRTSDEEPSPEGVRRALRDIVGRCLYGVDINPMAVELCKVNLWLEALEPGRPLSFLEHHIQCGNSLFGAAPALLKEGIPDDAFEPIEGDDRAFCRIFKKKNSVERESGQTSLLETLHEPLDSLGDLADDVATLDAIPDDTPEGQRAKQDSWERLVRSNRYESGRLFADAWCAAFVWKKLDDERLPYPITEAVFRRIERDALLVPQWLRNEIQQLACEYQFLHWSLAFPDVFHPGLGGGRVDTHGGSVGGFNAILGNPPWERNKPEAAKFFADSRPDISEAQTAAKRDKLLDRLATDDPALYQRWKKQERHLLGISQFLTASGMYPLTALGKFNLGNVFLELALAVVAPTGRAGLLNVSGVATDDSGSEFISNVMSNGRLISLFDFENRERLFPAVDSRYKFSAITLGGRDAAVAFADFVFFAKHGAELQQAERHIRLGPSDIDLLNPQSRTCPVFRSERQAQLVKHIYRVADLLRPPQPVLFRWACEPTFLFVMSDHSDLFLTEEDVARTEESLRLYESKMFHQFDHRWASLTADGTQVDWSDSEREDPARLAVPRYWMRPGDAAPKLSAFGHRWLPAVREVTNATNERTVIATMLPLVPVGHNAQVIRCECSAADAAALVGLLNSFVLDFAARTKVGGSHLSSFILRQLPLLPAERLLKPASWTGSLTCRDWIAQRVLELTYTAIDLEGLARDLGYAGPPFRWNADRRFRVRAELDAAFFHLYSIGRDDVEYIMDAFPILRSKDESVHGDYRTKHAVLGAYESMGKAPNVAAAAV